MNKDKMSEMLWDFGEEYLYESGLHSRGSLYRDKYVVVKAEAAFRDYAFYLFLCDKNHTAEDAVKSLSPSTFEEIENDEETYCADEKYIVFLKDTDQKKYGYPVYADLYGNTGNLINVYSVERTTCGDYRLAVRTDDDRNGIIQKLVYAFNNKDADVYACITEPPCGVSLYHNGRKGDCDELYTTMSQLYDTYGEMKTCYIQKPDGFVEKVPYIDGYGYFKLGIAPREADKDTDYLSACCYEGYELSAYGVKRYVIHTIETVCFCGEFAGECADEVPYKKPPRLTGVSAFCPNIAERFALKLVFENGDVRKYAHITGNYEKDDGTHPVCIAGKSFTDEIWASAHLADISPYAEAVVSFENGAVFSGAYLYENSTPYTEPFVYDTPQTVYSDGNYEVEKIWEWTGADLIGETGEDGILCVVTDLAFQGIESELVREKYTFASLDGKRLTSLDFDLKAYESIDIVGFTDGKSYVRADRKFEGYIFADMSLERYSDWTAGRQFSVYRSARNALASTMDENTVKGIEAKLGGEKTLWLYDGRYAVVERHYIPHNVVEVYRVIKK